MRDLTLLELLKAERSYDFSGGRAIKIFVVLARTEANAAFCFLEMTNVQSGNDHVTDLRWFLEMNVRTM